MTKGPLPKGTVKETGAEAGSILIGVGEDLNAELVLRVEAHQPPGSGGRIVGPFVVLHAGSAKYAPGIQTLVGQTFDSAAEFFQSLQQIEGCNDATHVVNANRLWRLDVGEIVAKVLVAEAGGQEAASVAG